MRREADSNDRRRSAVELDPDRWADVDRAYEPLIRRAATVGRGADSSPSAQERYVAALTDALADEALRLRAATRGGMVDGVYVAPANDAVAGRLLLATGAPRLNVSRAALGQRLLMVAETAAASCCTSSRRRAPSLPSVPPSLARRRTSGPMRASSRCATDAA